ncbi:phosphate/phosphite/phosphonate ABC transporter substrate-binding protein [Ensifer adhaerens]|uniref:phosphate/phosphite/phosphonate ABC transporter substrate-binding protein n=1 Tax=Ensifer adhaerens TaxID=106592 RepID=UPI0009901B98|nr:PhnD/SsuA/transferrin family substrate-binding protein [Ensifer adhaerens]
MRIASLAMYVRPPPLAAATAALWEFLRDDLRREGLADVPGRLDGGPRHDDAWLHPALLLAQTCGYPYVRHLRGKVRLVATPVYGHPGCNGPDMCSFVIVRADAPIRSLEDIRGTRAAINDPISNSGTNLFRVAIARHSRNGRFFSSVAETGSHLASIDAVASGTADVAAIDCVTYGNTQRFEPARVAGLRVLAATASAPGLPLITRGDASDNELLLLRGSLGRAITEPNLAWARDVLSLKDFAVLSDADYEPVAELARFAHRLGYPEIA